jgi:hypothetical protein
MGCSKETTSSKNIKTGGIAALIDVYADTDDTATVHVKLVVGGSSSNTYVDLEGTDSLTATVDGKTKTLSVVDSGIYEAKFTGVGAEAEVSVLLDRPDDETAADNSGQLPPTYTLDDPMSKLSRRDDPLDVTWAPSDSGDPMLLDFDGSCIFHYSKSVSDTGSYTVAKGTLDSTHDYEPASCESKPDTCTDMPETCDITLEVDRTQDGVADGKFDPESYFKLHERRKTTFTSNP